MVSGYTDRKEGVNRSRGYRSYQCREGYVWWDPRREVNKLLVSVKEHKITAEHCGTGRYIFVLWGSNNMNFWPWKMEIDVPSSKPSTEAQNKCTKMGHLCMAIFSEVLEANNTCNPAWAYEELYLNQPHPPLVALGLVSRFVCCMNGYSENL